MSGTPSQQQYCLRWNNYQNNLTNVFDQLLQSEAFVDVTLACDGHYLKAHKMVLSACSPYFQTLFFDNPCTHPIVILKDIKWDELKAVVEFMYRGEINVSQDQLAPLLKVAEVLKIRGLADVSRGGSTATNSGTNATTTGHQNNVGDSDSECGSVGHSLTPHHRVNTSNSQSLLHGLIASSSNSTRNDFLSMRKRRKLSITTPEDETPSPNGSSSINNNCSSNDVDEEQQQRSANNNGLILETSMGSNGSSPSPDTVALSNAALAAVCSNSSSPSVSGGGSNPLASLPSALLNLHSAAAAAAVAAAAANNATSTSHSGNGGPISSSVASSSLTSDLVDLKPGIVEMIREEERVRNCYGVYVYDVLQTQSPCHC